MATTSDILGASGPGTTITINGKEWTLTRSTKGIQAAWSKWLTDRAEERVFSTAEKYTDMALASFAKANSINRQYENVDPNTIPPDENARATEERDKALANGPMLQAKSDKAVERFNDRVAAGEFEYYGNVALDLAQQGLPGQIQLVYLCLKPKHPDITVEMVERLHAPDDEGFNHINEWREALMKSEGFAGKKSQPPNSSSSTPISTPPTPAP